MWNRRLALAAGLATGLALLAPAAPADAAKSRTLRAADGFRAKAPKGYRLAVREGAYAITGKSAALTLLAVRNGGGPREVAQALLAQGATLPATSGDRFGIHVALPSGRRGEVYFEGVPGAVSVLALEPRGARRSITGATRRELGRIARSARNIHPVAVPQQTVQETEPELPLKPFTTADGSAKAMVPDGPGWVAGGANGTVEGGHAEQGVYAFGVAVPFLQPGFALPGYAGLQAPFGPVRQAIEQAWPLFMRSANIKADNVRVVSEIPGSAGVLAPMDSGMFEIAFDAAPGPARGFMVAGVFQTIDGFWYLYYSFIAVRVGAPGNVGEALLRTWQSWDPSADQARRQAQTLITQQQTTQIIQSSNEYRRRVFEKTNANWSRYIRGQNPILDPVAPNAIGAQGQTLVAAPNGKFFDLNGNQFALPG